MGYQMRRILKSSLVVYLSALSHTPLYAYAQEVADRFVYPVVSANALSILENTVDPRQGGWFVANYVGNWCVCGTGTCQQEYHPGEDWNLNCAAGNDCDVGTPLYAVANGIVVFSADVSRLGWGLVIRHQLPVPEDLSVYVLANTSLPASGSASSDLVYSAYLHLASSGVPAVGAVVELGDQVGTIGRISGVSPHLHFETRWGEPQGFRCYQSSHQALTNRGLLSPTGFVTAHIPCSVPAGAHPAGSIIPQSVGSAIATTFAPLHRNLG